MERLRIRIRKGRDGPNTLVCTRPDGTVTMQHQQTGFFPLHDLSHYAVETVLHEVRGFWSLVLEGWDLGDFGKPWPRGPLPSEALLPELVVGQFDLERGTGSEVRAEALNRHIESWFSSNQPGAPVPAQLDELRIRRVRERMRALHSRWLQIAPGDSSELEFPATEDAI